MKKQTTADSFARIAAGKDTASRMPELQLQAMALVARLRGERKSLRAGESDRFKQFRPYEVGDPLNRIDARRSASNLDHNGHIEFLIREREQDISNIVYLWRKQAPSMDFKSAKALYSKQDAADILSMAMGYISIDSKEHFTLLGTDMHLRKDKAAASELSSHLMREDTGQNDTLPEHPVHRGQPLKKHSYAVIFSDLFPTKALFEQEHLQGKSPEDIRNAMMLRIAEKLKRFHDAGVKGYLIQILDPQEIEFDYKGTIRFEEGGKSALSHEVNKAEALRDNYLEARRLYQQALENTVKAMPGWTLHTYVTDRPLAEALSPLFPQLPKPPKPTFS